MDRRKSSALLVIVILLCVGALLAVVLGGTIATHTTTDRLDASSRRSECARQFSADDDEAFRQQLTKALTAAFNGDKVGVSTGLKNMAAIPNLADQVNEHCPPAIAKGNS